MMNQSRATDWNHRGKQGETSRRANANLMRTRKPAALRLFFALTLFISAAPLSALFALDFTARVVDPGTNKGIADAQLIVIETRQKYFTNARGEAKITVPGPGFYTFRAITPDGTLVQPRLQVLSQGQQLTIFTGEPPETTPDSGGDSSDITVRGNQNKQTLSRYQVRLDEIKRIPGQFGEALRGIESLPGVNAAPFGNGEIVLRGANEEANVYLVDDLPIGYAFHFFPVNSVLHNDLISTIDIYNGAYPADFGNATGGVIAIETIDEVERFGGNSSFSLWSTNALFKGVIPGFGSGDSGTGGEAGDAEDPDLSRIMLGTGIQLGQSTQAEDLGDANIGNPIDSKESDTGSGGYWIGAGRASYLHLTLSQFAPEGVRLPIYWDGQFKVKYSVSPHHSFYFYALGAKDTFTAEIDNTPEYDPTKDLDPVLLGANVAIDRAYHTEALRYIWQPGSKFRNTLTLINTDNIFFIQGRIGQLRADQEASIGYTGVRNDIDWDIVRDHVLFEGGIELRAGRYRNEGITARFNDPNDRSPDFFDTENPDFTVVPVRDYDEYQYNSAFAMLTLSGYGLEFKPGARVEHFGLTKQTVVDPRGTLSYAFPTGTTLLAGAGVYHRLPDPNEFSGSAGNPNLLMERAEHYAGGVQQELGDWLLKAEVFRQYFTDIVVEDPYITTPFRENQDEFTRYTQPILINDSLGFSNDGTGFSEGFELYIKKSKAPRVNGWYGWLSYTWSRAIRNNHQHIFTADELNRVTTADEARIIAQYDNTRDRFADFDRTHIINIVFGYQINPEWQFGARWRYQTAAPYTQIIGDDGGRQQNQGRRIFDPVFSPYENTERTAAFHRLDLRIDRFFRYGWGYGNFFVELLNVYVRRNETGKSWNRSRPFSATNPEPVYDFVLLQQSQGDKTYFIPFFNVGIEMKF